MAEKDARTIRIVNDITISDICGLWEVIRICEGDSKVLYLWLGERFLFYFLNEMMFVCINDGQHSHSKWELTEKTFGKKKQFSIILNGIFEYTIVKIDEGEIIPSNQKCEYLLVRKL